MSRLVGPPPRECPLEPGPVQSSRPDGGKFVVWRASNGWAVAWRRPLADRPDQWAFDVIVHGLSCWHTAWDVASSTRWDPGSDDPKSPFYQRGGWTSSGLPMSWPLEIAPGVVVCEGCYCALTGTEAPTSPMDQWVRRGFVSPRAYRQFARAGLL